MINRIMLVDKLVKKEGKVYNSLIDDIVTSTPNNIVDNHIVVNGRKQASICITPCYSEIQKSKMSKFKKHRLLIINDKNAFWFKWNNKIKGLERTLRSYIKAYLPIGVINDEGMLFTEGVYVRGDMNILTPISIYSSRKHSIGDIAVYRCKSYILPEVIDSERIIVCCSPRTDASCKWEDITYDCENIDDFIYNKYGSRPILHIGD